MEVFWIALAGFAFTFAIGVQTQLFVSRKPIHLPILIIWTFVESMIWCYLIRHIVINSSVAPTYSLAAAGGAVLAFLLNWRLRK